MARSLLQSQPEQQLDKPSPSPERGLQHAKDTEEDMLHQLLTADQEPEAVLASHGGSGNAPSRPASAGATASGRAKHANTDSAHTSASGGQASPSSRHVNDGCATRITDSDTAAGVPAHPTCSLDLELAQGSVPGVLSQRQPLQSSVTKHAAHSYGSHRDPKTWANDSTEPEAGHLSDAACKAGGEQIQSQFPAEGVPKDTDAPSKEARAKSEQLAGEPLTRPSFELKLPSISSIRESFDLTRMPGQGVGSRGFDIAHADTSISSSAAEGSGMAGMRLANTSVPHWHTQDRNQPQNSGTPISAPFTNVRAFDAGIDLPGTDNVDGSPRNFRDSSSRGSVRWRSFRHYSFRRSSVEGTGQYKKRRWSLILVSCLRELLVSLICCEWTRKGTAFPAGMLTLAIFGNGFLPGLAADKCGVLVNHV